MIDYVAVGSIIIDDIVDPQGRSTMGVLGGGGSHAAAGMRVWSQNTTLVSAIGTGLPANAMAHLASLAQTGGFIHRATPQPRAWQLFEANGARQEVFRTSFDAFCRMIPQPADYPAALAAARGVYLQTPTLESTAAWVHHLRRLNPNLVILWEPWEIFYHPQNLAGFYRLAPQLDIISPDTAEVHQLTGQADPTRQVDMLLAGGVRALALRLGKAGSLVGQAGQVQHIPALSMPVVDETGAGNSYCGGFLVGFVESGGNLLTAGRYGTVSATFALEQVGPPRLGQNTAALARQRLAALEHAP
jgi:ribokinase